MNRQEIFDKIFCEYRNKTQRSMELHQCAYRTADATGRCFIGFFIPDEAYTRAIEGKGLCGIVGVLEQAFGALTQEDLSFLSRLQRVHDSHKDGYPFETDLRAFAISEGISVPA